MAEIQSADFLKESSIEIRPISRFVDKEDSDEKPHRHPFQEIIFILSGEGSHTIDGEEFELTPNTLYVIGEGQVHQFLKGRNLNGFVLRYKQSFLPAELAQFASNYSLFQMISESNSIELEQTESTIFETQFNSLIEEKERSENLSKNLVFQFLLLSLLSRIDRIIKLNSIPSEISDDNSDEAIFKNFAILLEKHFQQEHHIQFYSDKLNIGPRKLAEILVESTGFTVKQHIQKRLLVEAKRLLKFTNLSAKEISYDLGFTQPAYFSRLFKNKVGRTPKEYRSQEL